MTFRSAILAALCLAACWYYALCYSSAVHLGLKPGVVNDYFQLWNASRAVLHHQDPYGLQVAERDQLASYGATAKSLGMANDRGLAYPIQGTFPLLALGLLEFDAADKIALCLFAAFVALSVGWLRGRWDRTTVLYCVLTFSSYPVIYNLQSRQPTLLFFGLIVGSLALLRSDCLILSGILAALAVGKPQIGLSVLLPMLVWTLARWQEQKRFAFTFGASMLTMVSISSVMFPGWFQEWLSSLQSYSRYSHPSLVVSIFGSQLGAAISVILFTALVAALWLHRKSDLLFQVAFSVIIFDLIVPYQTYNAVMLLIPVVWAEDTACLIPVHDWVNRLTLAAMRAALVGSWIANGVGIILWHTSPLGKTIAWLLPGIMVRVLLGSLLVMLLVQLFFPGRRMAANLATAGRSVALA